MENVTVIDHSNLRVQNMNSIYEEGKHIRKEKINIYAGNIKASLRKAYGIIRNVHALGSGNGGNSVTNNMGNTDNLRTRFQQMAGYSNVD